MPAKAISVLPFVNMSGDPKKDYFSHGITDENLDALALVPDLKVAARTLAFAFKGDAEELRNVRDDPMHMTYVASRWCVQIGGVGHAVTCFLGSHSTRRIAITT